MPTAQDGYLLVVNAGSSSLKFAAFAHGPGEPDLHLRGAVDGRGSAARFHARDARGRDLPAPAWRAGDDASALVDALVGWIGDTLGGATLAAAGHRIALGSPDLSAPVVVDRAIIDRLRALVPLAPLHVPRNLEPIEALAQFRPDLPQVACFDTAFHRTMPPVASAYALPRDLTEAGAIRYGFHGLSYEYVASALPSLDDRAARGRTVVAHLGSGASMCALLAGRSVATTMGFSPLSGLVMTTRPGEIDPGLILWLIRERGMDADAIEALLYRRSGLLGVSGLSGDMRELLASPDQGAREAVDLFVYRAARELGSLAAAAGGLDALVFTGGIGEHSAPIRKAICRASRWLGIEIDDEANAGRAGRISAVDSPVSVWVVPTDEERMIARHTAAAIASP
jgi:acetate kinase